MLPLYSNPDIVHVNMLPLKPKQPFCRNQPNHVFFVALPALHKLPSFAIDQDWQFVFLSLLFLPPEKLFPLRFFFAFWVSWLIFSEEPLSVFRNMMNQIQQYLFPKHLLSHPYRHKNILKSIWVFLLLLNK